MLLGLFFAVKAWSYWLDRYLLLYSDNGVVVGASYTDLTIGLPVLWVLVGLSVISAVASLANLRSRTYRLLLAAPALVFCPMLASWAVLPFAQDIVGTNLNIGLLYLTTLGSMTVLGIVIAGWASNNKYALVGGLRSAGQLISYEIPQILALVSVALVVGSLSMIDITRSQTGPFVNVLILPFSFLIYFIAALAETNRTPFDLPEAESELVAGWLTEYSGMRWGTMLALSEYGNVTVVCAIITTLWFGGWQGPGVDAIPLLGVLWFTLKVYAFIVVMMWIRATLPRLRIDQLMSFCWKGLIPMALVNIVAVATLALAFPNSLVPIAIANWVLVVVFIAGIPFVQRRRLAALRARARAATAPAVRVAS